MQTKYSRLSRILHWSMALVIPALFGVGFWMVELTYYSSWYKTAPHWHKSIGILLAMALLLRWGWLLKSGKPPAIAQHSRWQQHASRVVHALLYLLLTLIIVSGYLISTADGRGIEVFQWFTLPSLGEFFPHQADIAGEIHRYSAYSLMGLVVLHAAAALKHQLIDKDGTLRRMW